MNFDTFPILSFLTFMPLLGALFVMMIRGEGDAVRQNAVNVGAFVSFAVFWSHWLFCIVLTDQTRPFSL